MPRSIPTLTAIPALPTSTATALPSPTTTPSPTPEPDKKSLIARYGSTLYPSLNDMPVDLQWYYVKQVDEIATFFKVRPADVLTFLQLQSGGLRLQAPDEGAEGGIAQVNQRRWNGWANPERDVYVSDLRLIEQYGGVGFDWSMRQMWTRWQEEGNNGWSLMRAFAEPEEFENAIASVARHLARQGLTREQVGKIDDINEQLAKAVVLFNGSNPLAKAIATPQATATSENLPVVSPLLRAIFHNLMDRTFGVNLSDGELTETVDRSLVALDVVNGLISADEGARRLLQETIKHYLAEGKAADDAGLPLPWPYLYNDQTVVAQQLAVQQIGRTLTAWELDYLLSRYGDDQAELNDSLANRADARLFTGVMRLFNSGLRRSQRGLPLTITEVSQLMQPFLAHRSMVTMSTGQMQELTDRIEYNIRIMPEYKEINGIKFFKAKPLDPMPRIIKAFGAPAPYQPGGFHSGIDVRSQRQGGKQPLLYAVDDGTVVHVGPLYCEVEGKCRGSHAIIIHHGNYLYTIYSHNSEAHVEIAQQVEAGQPIGRQGNEGYSFGSHLHFEVMVGCGFTGNWLTPWGNCTNFVNPLPWLPASSEWVSW
jgi:murein DD-endopeptidase MepM/ murein hydrolase activator NlpD